MKLSRQLFMFEKEQKLNTHESEIFVDSSLPVNQQLFFGGAISNFCPKNR